MRKWMKGIVIAGVTLLFIGTAITALAAAVGNVQEKSYNSLAGYHFNFGVMKSIGNALRPGKSETTIQTWSRKRIGIIPMILTFPRKTK